MATSVLISAFLQSEHFAVVGASVNRAKIGYNIYINTKNTMYIYIYKDISFIYTANKLFLHDMHLYIYMIRNRVLRYYQDHKLSVFPIHRSEPEIEGSKTYTSVPSIFEQNPHVNAANISISFITPPAVTLNILKTFAPHDITERIWLQPGAESEEVVAYAQQQGLSIIYGGPCVLLQPGPSKQ